MISVAARCLTCCPGCSRTTQTTAFPPLMLCSIPTSKRSVAIHTTSRVRNLRKSLSWEQNRSAFPVRLQGTPTMSTCVLMQEPRPGRNAFIHNGWLLVQYPRRSKHGPAGASMPPGAPLNTSDAPQARLGLSRNATPSVGLYLHASCHLLFGLKAYHRLAEQPVPMGQWYEMYS